MSRTDALSQLGAAVVEVREAQGLSQEDVVERIQSDHDRREQSRPLRSASGLDAIERGRDDPSFLTLVDIARAIDVPLAEILVRLGPS